MDSLLSPVSIRSRGTYVNAKFMPGFGNGLRACDVLIMSEISGGGVKAGECLDTQTVLY